MGRKSNTAPQRDITKAIRAAMDAGVLIQRIELGAEGSIVIVSREAAAAEPATALDAWRRTRAAR